MIPGISLSAKDYKISVKIKEYVGNRAVLQIGRANYDCQVSPEPCEISLQDTYPSKSSLNSNLGIADSFSAIVDRLAPLTILHSKYK